VKDTTPVTLGDLTRLFGKIGLISFGGPAGQIALMHEEVVDRKNGSAKKNICRRSTCATCCLGQRHSNWPHGLAGGSTVRLAD